MIHLRPYQSSDRAELPRFLALAAHEDTIQNVWDNPDLTRYIADFGRAGDAAIVAQHEAHEADEADEAHEAHERVIGIAWARFWTSEDHGFGWLDEATPEIAMAVVPRFRGQGIGARLIEALKSHLREAGAAQVSLNVRADSPAVRLYQRLGFERIAGSERRNRTGGQSFNMSAPLS